MGRENQFSCEGLEALYDYLTDMEEDTGEEVELDVIALCCEYSEYATLEEYLADYCPDIYREDYDDYEEFKEAVVEYIENNTTLIRLGNDKGFIIRAY
jgi:hypothetical protein